MKYSTTITFLVGILLFFLPFVEIKCNATPLYEAKGIDLVTGFTVDNPNKQSTDLFDTRNDVKNEKQEGSIFALGAFIFGIIGLILSFTNFKSMPVISMVTGLLAAACLIALMIQVKSDLGKWSSPSTPNKNAGEDFFNGLSNTIKITADFTTWFYLSLISFLAAAFFSYKKGLPPIPSPTVQANVGAQKSETMTE